MDDRLRLEEFPERLVAVVRFRGRAGRRDVAKRTEQLLQVVAREKFTVEGQPFLMRYNPPFVPGFMRRNEIGVVVRI
jgi:DNA gyrase inhibitor GyrI